MVQALLRCFQALLFSFELTCLASIIPVSFQGNVISTPAIKGTILPGITRKSIIDVARSQGFQVF